MASQHPSQFPDWKSLDFATVFDYRLSVAFSRTLSIWISIAILAALAVFSADKALPVRSGAYLFMWITIIALTRLLSSMNKAHFTFTNHARWLESQVGEIGISSYWSYYLRTSFSDSLTYAYIFSTRLLNAAIVIYILITSVLAVIVTPADIVIYVIQGVASLTSLALFIWVNAYIRNEVDPQGFAPRIAQGIRDAREQAIELQASRNQ